MTDQNNQPECDCMFCKLKDHMPDEASAEELGRFFMAIMLSYQLTKPEVVHIINNLTINLLAGKIGQPATVPGGLIQ